MSRWLSREDVVRMTKRKKFKAQRRKLDAMGVYYKEAADGEPLVPVDGEREKVRNHGPRWDRMTP